MKIRLEVGMLGPHTFKIELQNTVCTYVLASDGGVSWSVHSTKASEERSEDPIIALVSSRTGVWGKAPSTRLAVLESLTETQELLDYGGMEWGVAERIVDLFLRGDYRHAFVLVADTDTGLIEDMEHAKVEEIIAKYKSNKATGKTEIGDVQDLFGALGKRPSEAN